MRTDLVGLFVDPPINPPADYPAWVWVLGVLVVLAGLAGPVAVRVVERLRDRGPAYGLGVVRAAALADIDAVQRQHATGDLDAPEAQRRLAAAVRAFAGAATDSDVEGLTLRELADRAALEPRLAPVAELVREVYPVAFAGGPGRPVAEVADRAREVVTAWS